MFSTIFLILLLLNKNFHLYFLCPRQSSRKQQQQQHTQKKKFFNFKQEEKKKFSIPRKLPYKKTFSSELPSVNFLFHSLLYVLLCLLYLPQIAPQYHTELIKKIFMRESISRLYGCYGLFFQSVLDFASNWL